MNDMRKYDLNIWFSTAHNRYNALFSHFLDKIYSVMWHWLRTIWKFGRIKWCWQLPVHTSMQCFLVQILKNHIRTESLSKVSIIMHWSCWLNMSIRRMLTSLKRMFRFVITRIPCCGTYPMLIIFSSCFQQTLLTAANLLQLTDVRDACCDYLQTQLDPSNCLGIRDFADIHGCVDLVNYANTYIDQHFAWVICLPVKIYKENELISFSRFHSEIIQYDEFFNLQHDQVAALVKSDRLTVQSEEKVYESVIGWIQFDDAERRKYLPELLEHVRLPLVAQDYLVLRVENEPLIKENLLCKDYIIEALKYHLLKNDAKNTLKSVRTIPRQPIGLPKILLVIGGQAPKAIRSVECYDLREEQWYQAAEMPSRRCRWVFSARSLFSIVRFVWQFFPFRLVLVWLYSMIKCTPLAALTDHCAWKLSICMIQPLIPGHAQQVWRPDVQHSVRINLTFNMKSHKGYFHTFFCVW